MAHMKIWAIFVDANWVCLVELDQQVSRHASRYDEAMTILLEESSS
ncbi:hypothetical protein EV200_10251 [Pedobacter psychrotolerans]|uniref:Uncharacterized protein n=1 Tax=Pedobacter psychrotolerans TaxID=1843235 RepID=A0A4R2HHG1_9SPHI|nr:hypothetical protein EV200_10251 [Pedobacter psychrotolerans]